MPHLTLEYTSNLAQFDAAGALLHLNRILADSGHVKSELDIKARAIRLDTFRIGTTVDERAFISVKLALLSGRSAQVKREISEMLLAALQGIDTGATQCHLQLSVELLDMDSYSKSLHML